MSKVQRFRSAILTPDDCPSDDRHVVEILPKNTIVGSASCEKIPESANIRQ